MARPSRGSSRQLDGPLALCVVLVGLVIVALDGGTIKVFTQPNADGSGTVLWVLEVSDDGGASWTEFVSGGPVAIATLAGAELAHGVDPALLFRLTVSGTGVPYCVAPARSNVVES